MQRMARVSQRVDSFCNEINEIFHILVSNNENVIAYNDNATGATHWYNVSLSG